ncbi:neurofilament light polypeptide-like [Papaver somniferum]|uniref:neurofilament light polypeptide-like n=1 Tax=Papaver somniferum TaxID=3469 RepID=UPI000E6F989E|nr:neurofilament light polypeptide-like [Papaver somniferum]
MRKHDHATPKPLGPRQKGGKNLNASHGRATGSKAKGTSINDPPSQAEQPTHEEPDSDTPTEQEGGEEERNEEQSGAKEGGEEEKEGDEEGDIEIREVVQEQEGDPKGKPDCDEENSRNFEAKNRFSSTNM